MTLLAGACVCCTGRETLRTALRQIRDDCSGPTKARTETIMPEPSMPQTSGLADPGAILALIQSVPILIADRRD
jgi:G3E family GTPase